MAGDGARFLLSAVYLWYTFPWLFKQKPNPNSSKVYRVCRVISENEGPSADPEIV